MLWVELLRLSLILDFTSSFALDSIRLLGEASKLWFFNEASPLIAVLPLSASVFTVARFLSTISDSAILPVAAPMILLFLETSSLKLLD